MADICKQRDVQGAGTWVKQQDSALNSEDQLSSQESEQKTAKTMTHDQSTATLKDESSSGLYSADERVSSALQHFLCNSSMNDSPNNLMTNAKGRRLRFSTHNDIMVLREVLAANPFEDISRWVDVTTKVVEGSGKNFSQRCIRDHVDLLLERWARKDHANLKKSCTEVEYLEKGELLEQVKTLREEAKHKKWRRKRQRELNTHKVEHQNATNFPEGIKKMEVNVHDFENSLEGTHFLHLAEQRIPSGQMFLPQDVEENCSSTSSERERLFDFDGDVSQVLEVSEETSSNLQDPLSYGDSHERRKRGLKLAALQFLEKKAKKDAALREREVALQERKLCLEEERLRLEREKFALDKLEREARLKMELEQSARNSAIIAQQQSIIELFVQQMRRSSV